LHDRDLMKENAAQHVLEQAIGLAPTEKPPEAVHRTTDRLGRLLEAVD
jgi:hypothetical protein